MRAGARITRGAWTLAALLSACAVLAPVGRGETVASIVPALRLDRFGAHGELGIRIQFADPGARVPAPVARVTLRFPPGFRLEVPRLRSCSESRLQALGANACPGASMLGRGRALVIAYIGSQLVAEPVSLRLFLGPLRNLQPTVEVFGEGVSPFAEQVVLDGLVFADPAPYGERLVLAIPPIATVPQEPDASVSMFSLTVGANGREHHDRATLHVPAKCPAGGFLIVGEFAYADGTSGVVRATIPCPSRSGRHER